jgi:ABC-type cobalamin/Fe3+-siderophores transport system ATPase subunit
MPRNFIPFNADTELNMKIEQVRDSQYAYHLVKRMSIVAFTNRAYTALSESRRQAYMGEKAVQCETKLLLYTPVVHTIIFMGECS